MSGRPAIKIKIQLFCGDEIAMGPGKADVLDAIALHGSISAAGRVLGMSYRRVWLLVDVMNRCWREPLVETSPGRAQGSGARLSRLGQAVLSEYRSLQRGLAEGASGRSAEALLQEIRSAPRVSQKDLSPRG